MQYKASRREQPVFILCFHCGGDVGLQKLGLQQILKELQAAMGASAYVPKDGRIKKFLMFSVSGLDGWYSVG